MAKAKPQPGLRVWVDPKSITLDPKRTQPVPVLIQAVDPSDPAAVISFRWTMPREGSGGQFGYSVDPSSGTMKNGKTVRCEVSAVPGSYLVIFKSGVLVASVRVEVMAYEAGPWDPPERTPDEPVTPAPPPYNRPVGSPYTPPLFPWEWWPRKPISPIPE